MNGPTQYPSGNDAPENSNARGPLVDGHPDSIRATNPSPRIAVAPSAAGNDQLLLRKALARWENEGGHPPGTLTR